MKKEGYVIKLMGLPIGDKLNKFEGIPERRYINKALFIQRFSRVMKKHLLFSLN